MQYRWVRLSVLACLSVGTQGLIGCSSEGDAALAEALRNVQGVMITGSVGDGPVVGATIVVVSADGAVVSQTTGGSTASFVVLVPANTRYPIRLRAVGGTDLVSLRTPDFTLETVITSPKQVVANLSPFSTLVARSFDCDSQAVGQAAVRQSWDQVMTEFGMGYDTERFGHPSWSKMGPRNQAPFVLASEALGESIRRTRAALSAGSVIGDDDSVVSALACDLVADGRLDGMGEGASRRSTATFRAAAAGVLLETVAKQLRVDGQDAMSRLDQAIQRTGASTGSVLAVEPTPALIGQTRRQLVILLGQVPGDLVVRFLRLLDETALASLSEVVAANLRTGDGAALAKGIAEIAVADDVSIDAMLDGSDRISSSAQPVVSFAATPSGVRPGETARLSWAAEQAETCWAAGGWTGEQPLEGTHVTARLMTPERYEIVCTGLGGTVRKAATVAVAESTPQSPPLVDLIAVPATIKSGENVTLSWMTNGAAQCNAKGDWSGSKSLQGSTIVGPLDGGRSYTLICTGPGGTGGSTISVIVQPATPGSSPSAPITASLRASPGWVAAGGSTTLTWSSTEATGCAASGAWSGSKLVNGSGNSGPISVDSTFTINCTGRGGNAVASTTVSTRLARLSWRPPEGGASASSRVSGFKIYRGTLPGIYGPPIIVPDPAARSFEIALEPGTYYFSLGVIDAEGGEVARSNEVSKSIE